MEDALPLPASWSQQAALGPCDALKTIDAELLSALLLDGCLRLVDDGRQARAKARDAGCTQIV